VRLTAFNYIRSMGRVVISNLSDLYRGATSQGLGRFMSQGVPALDFQSRRGEAVRQRGAACRAGDARASEPPRHLGEIGDPYRAGTAMERLLQNGTRAASVWNGMSLFTDMSKAIASIMSQNRILEAVQGRQTTFGSSLISASTATWRARSGEFAQHGETLDGVRVANTGKWADGEAVRAYRAAVSKEVDSVVVTRSVGDVPLFANTPLGKALLQFRTYNLASHQRVLLRGMQEGPGALHEHDGRHDVRWPAFRMAARLCVGRRALRAVPAAAENPGYLIGEALDASGFFALPIEAAATVDTMTGINPIKDPLMAAFPDAPQNGQGAPHRRRSGR
jgi:hypothetical protein